MEARLSALVQTIEQGIRRRGFFVLMDERLALIAGAQPLALDQITTFAARHGWTAQLAGDRIFFTQKVQPAADGQTEAPAQKTSLPFRNCLL